MYALQWPELSPPTWVTNSVDEVVALAREHGRVVIKPWDGNGGRGVLITSGTDRNLRSMAELLTQEGRVSILVQPFLEAIKDGDKRIILVDGEPRGWFLRVPGPDDHRGNMHVGATVHGCELDARDQAICAALEGRLKAEGLLFVGIDVIGGFLTEINVTSPTGLREIQTLMDRDLAAELLDAADRVLAAR
jgi:glutathione synthase